MGNGLVGATRVVNGIHWLKKHKVRMLSLRINDAKAEAWLLSIWAVSQKTFRV